jgi:hypothetical protein
VGWREGGLPSGRSDLVGARPMVREPRDIKQTLVRTRKRSMVCGRTEYLVRVWDVRRGMRKRKRRMLVLAVSV